MKQQVKLSQSPAFRLFALVLAAVLLVGCLVLPAAADADPVTITRLEWQNAEDLVYGEADRISVVAYDADDTAYYGAYAVKYPSGYGQANTEYTVTAVLSDTTFAEDPGLVHTKNVTIAPKSYGVTFKSKTVAGDGATPYNITVAGVDDKGNEMPYELRAQINYTVNGQSFKGTATYGTYTVTATLPVGNYKFFSNGAEVGELTATLTVSRQKEIVPVKSGDETRYYIFLTADLADDGTEVGLSENVTATATVIDNLKAPKGTKYAQSFEVKILNAAEGETFTLLVGLDEIIYKPGCLDLDAQKDVYIYQDGTVTTAKACGYTVSLGTEGSVKISGVPASVGSLIVSFAPQYKGGGLPLIWIIIIIVIILLALVIFFFFMGRKVDHSYRAEQKEEPVPAKEEEDDKTVPAMAPVEPAADTDPTQPAMRGLVYIDVVKKPEEYGRMLMKEEAGEGVVVYRYRKSYLSKLAMADGKIGEYYSVVKNALLHFHGVKARKSWNYEAFNQGRNQIARIIPNGKTLYVYLAIDPKTLEGTKYGAIDVSDKKKFEATPSLMKVRGDRKLKFALELIEKICGEQLALKPLEKPDEDYKPVNQSAEKLFEAGMIRKMAALAPLTPEAPAEEAKTEEAPAEQTAEQPAETPVEEAPATEAPAEETLAEQPAEEAPKE